MALPGVDADRVIELNAAQRFQVFCDFARHTDSPTLPYAIRIGSKTLFSADTHDLREKFDGWVRRLQRRKRQEGKRKR